jgi:hypothetical protein
VSGHLLLGAPVEDHDSFRTQSKGGLSGIDCNVSAADDYHLVTDLDSFFPNHLFEEIQPV